jgi:Spy/CpxP family protein refolding chaperone
LAAKLERDALALLTPEQRAKIDEDEVKIQKDKEDDTRFT